MPRMSCALAARGAFVAVGLALAVTGCGGPGPGEAIGQSEAPVTFTNDQAAFDYFLGKGLANFQAAGIVGNLDQESGVDPTAVQSGGPGRGIAQWSVGGRWDTDSNDNATWYAGTQGQNVLSLQLQLDFIWYELTTFPNYGLAALQQSTNVTDATVAFETDFEGCGTCDQSTRISYAQNVLSTYGSDSVDGGSSADAGPTPCFVTSLNMSGVCILTSACAALPNHVSTPNYCPGPADIECCTGPSEDAGMPSQGDTGAPPPPSDAGVDASEADSGSAPQGDAGLPHGGGDGGDAGMVVPPGHGGSPVESTAPSMGSKGCATAPGPTTGALPWLVVGAACLVRRRRRSGRCDGGG